MSLRPEYVETERGQDVLAKLRVQVAKAGKVLLATDPDREGEAIAWHLADALGLSDAERVTFQEITPAAVTRAVSGKPRPINMELVAAQEARRVLDRVVGYKVSPAISRAQNQRLSAGRVQSPAVRLVVERERAIRAFQPVKHFGAVLRFSTPRPWFAEWDTAPLLAKDQKFMLDAELARAAADVRSVVVESIEEGRAASAPPAPFTTSSLQQAAQAKLKFKPKKTMDLAQALYEQGAITYHRTDQPNLSKDGEEAVAAFARTQGWLLPSTRRRFKAKEGAQEAHEAIRPTYVDELEAGETDDEKALYRLIWTRTVASQLADASFAVRTVVLRGQARTQAGKQFPCRFVAKGRTLTAKGWKVVYNDEDEQDQDEAQQDNPVPALGEGERLEVAKGEVQAKSTKAPPRFTASTLIKEMESLGIGRPSTYAAILENILAREYVAEDRKGFLAPLPAGEVIVDALVGKCSFIELDFTRELESQLDAVAGGERSFDQVVRPAVEVLDQQLGAIKAVAGPPCPDCHATHGGSLRKVTLPNAEFWGCVRHAEGCKATYSDQGGKPYIVACPVCAKTHGGRFARIKGPKGFFWGCTRYAQGCKASAKDKGGKPDMKTLRK